MMEEELAKVEQEIMPSEGQEDTIGSVKGEP